MKKLSVGVPGGTRKRNFDRVSSIEGRGLVVEYKGADRWQTAEPARKVGELLAELSHGKCLFVMVKDKRWDWIEEKLKAEIT